MAYQRTEYHREVDRDDDKQGGWRSWFGLGDKKDDGYNYSTTSTYRNTQPTYGDRYESTGRTGYSGAVSGGYSGARGGYGYTTSDEVTRGPSYNVDREYGNTRQGYGQSTGDRDNYYKQETRTYGGDRDNSWAQGRSTTPSRSYGFSGERDYPSRGYTGGDFSYSSRYPTTGDHPTGRYQSNDYQTSRYQTGGDYTPSRYQTSGDYTPSRSYGFSGERDYPSTSRSYGYNGDRDTSRTLSGGYGGDREYTRGSYQPSSYRY